MKISKSSHKDLLLSLFYEEKNTAQGLRMVGKDFPLEELLAASTAKSKVMFKIIDEKPTWPEDEIEFTPSEIVILKKLFDAKRSWNVDLAQIIEELKTIFNT